MRLLLEDEAVTSSRRLLELDHLGLSVATVGFLTLNSKGAGVAVKRAILEVSALNLLPSRRQMVERSRAIMKEPMNDQ